MVVLCTMLLREFISDEEMHEAMRLTNQPPHLMPIFYSIRHHLMKTFPASPIRLFGYPSDEPLVWFIHRRNIYVKEHIIIWPNPHITIVEEQFNDALQQFFEHYTLEEASTGLLPDNLTEMFLKFIHSKSNFSPLLYPTHLYFMNEEQQKLVSELELKLPKGYRFDEVDPTNDANIINQTWRHASDGDLQQTTEKLRCLPSAIIRYGDKAVSFEMSDPMGAHNHLYTLDEHRRKGLGTTVELRLSQKCIKEAIWPFKFVELYNKLSLDASNRSPYWTRYESHNNTPRVLNFFRMDKK
uniref:Glycine N-acyltransferase-like protein n=3 Tax=Parascaris univalens TaxID=6257 RepID=A0A914ZEK2_PARUN